MIPDDEIIIEDEIITPKDEASLRRALLDELPEDLAEKTIQNKKAALGDAAELSTRIIKRLSKRAQRKTRIGTLDFAASQNYSAFLPMLYENIYWQAFSMK